MNAPSIRQFRFWLLAATLAPTLATLVVRFGSTAGPREASADVNAATPEIEPATLAVTQPDKPLTDRQRAALAWLRGWNVSQLDSLQSPLLAPNVVAGTVEKAPATDTVQQTDQESALDVPRLRITGMMSGGGVHYASLNHRLSRVGDTVAAGWIVRAIDPVRQAVELEHSGGTVLELFADRPKLTGGE